MYPSRCGIRTGGDQKALQVFIKGGDARNKLEALLIKSRNILIFSESERPTVEDFLKLAKEENYGPAYVEAAEMLKDLDKKIDYLNKAIDTCKFYPAYIDLGYLFDSRGEKEKALIAFENAGKNGISLGYVLCGTLIANDLRFFYSSNTDQNLKRLSTQEKEQVVDYFKRAGQAHNPEGWTQLANYSATLASLVDDKEEKESLYRIDFEALEQGIKLGSDTAYYKVELGHFSDKLSELIQRYGPPPYEGYYREVERQLQEK